jgi:hypothetical protein
MDRRTVHRWIAALALVAALGVMGARPMAAADLGWMDRLASLWSAGTDGKPMGFWDTVIGWFDGTQREGTFAKEDRGAGVDPNGSPATASLPEPGGVDPQ